MIHYTVLEADDPRIVEVCDVIRVAQEELQRTEGLVLNTYGITPSVMNDRLRQYDGKCIVAQYDDRVVGTACLLKECQMHWYGESHLVIRYVAVLPSYSGKHIASNLLTIAKDVSCGETISISTDERNVHAVRVYERSGFKVVEYVRGRHADSNAIVLACGDAIDSKHAMSVKLHVIIAKLKCAIKAILKL